MPLAVNADPCDITVEKLLLEVQQLRNPSRRFDSSPRNS
jgi:hypothetical protein